MNSRKVEAALDDERAYQRGRKDGCGARLTATQAEALGVPPSPTWAVVSVLEILLSERARLKKLMLEKADRLDADAVMQCEDGTAYGSRKAAEEFRQFVTEHLEEA